MPTVSLMPVILPTVSAKPHPVIPYSEVTNEIENLLPTRCRVIRVVLIEFTGVC